MTNYTSPAFLATLSFDGLGRLYASYANVAHDATRSGRSRNIAATRRGRVADEVSRRGAVVRRVNADLHPPSAYDAYMVGRPADFEPIKVA